MKPPTLNSVELPDPFQFADRTRVQTIADWDRRRIEIRDLIVGKLYGGLPPAPASVRAEELHTLHETSAAGLDKARFITFRLHVETARPFSFLMQVLIPKGPGPFPVVLDGDACWPYLTDEIAAEVVRRGNIFATFDRVEIASDGSPAQRSSGLYRVYPKGKFGALAAWAWGYHRCVDALTGMDFVDSSRIAVNGHSRGGKASLLAGATDDRIALTAANNSGCGGAGSWHWQEPDAEKLSDMSGMFPHWLGPRAKSYIDRQNKMPFDQHFLKALVAPRRLLTTEALGDRWANPRGTLQTHLAAKEVFRFLGAEDRIGIRFREGDHHHGIEDWRVFLDFMDWQLRGIAPAAQFNDHPFPDLPSAFSWTAPTAEPGSSSIAPSGAASSESQIRQKRQISPK